MLYEVMQIFVFEKNLKISLGFSKANTEEFQTNNQILQHKFEFIPEKIYVTVCEKAMLLKF